MSNQEIQHVFNGCVIFDEVASIENFRVWFGDEADVINGMYHKVGRHCANLCNALSDELADHVLSKLIDMADNPQNY